MKKILLAISSLLILASCEDVVDVDLETRPPQLIVDAWITDTDSLQVLTLTTSAPYFDNSSSNYVDDAIVTITNGGGESLALNSLGQGRYAFSGDSFDINVGGNYKLNIEWAESSYEATSDVRPVAPIDSISYSREAILFGDGDQDSIWVAQFWGTDLEGIGDCYWVRSYKNDTLLSNNIVLAYDAGTAPGAKTDNVPFILPIRFGINPDGEEFEFYQPFDTIRVDLYSISPEAWDFWNILRGQLNNGGLFATPPVNVPTNIVKTSGNGPDPLGWFQTSAVSTQTRVLDPAKASKSFGS